MWRKPDNRGEGQEKLVKSPELYDADFNEKSTAAGVILAGEGDSFMAVCATWCDYQDHYHTTEINGDFLVHDLPE